MHLIEYVILKDMNIDFHAHIIPNVDDGADSIEMSIEMLKELKSQGVDAAVATPHFYALRQNAASFLAARDSEAAKLLAALKDSGLVLGKDVPHILYGAEVAYTVGIESMNLKELCISNSNVILFEMPMREWGLEELDALSSLIYDQHLTVIIAHFERYADLQTEEIIKRFKKLPLYIQINAHSVIVRSRRKDALKLFEEYDNVLIATDAHNMSSRPPHIEKARKIIAQKLGQNRLDRIDKLSEEIFSL